MSNTRNETSKVAVCSRSFSKNETLKSELLSRYSNVTFNETGLQLEGDALIKFLSGHDKAITALEKIDDYILSHLPELKVIGKYGVGVDMIDMNAMRKHKIHLGWKGGVNKRSASELALCLMLMMLRHVPQSNSDIRSGVWKQHVGELLTNKTVGIIGCGNIGKDLVALLKPFSCKILVNDVKDYTGFYIDNSIEPVELKELMKRSDVVTIHTPLDESTNNLISKEHISLMKSSAILINVARGGLIDEAAVKKALDSGKLAAAAFDVFQVEPPHDNELINLSNFYCTSHIGGSAAEAILAMGRAAIDGLDDNYIP